MPNWCENELKIEGNRKDLAELKKFAKGKNGVLDFNSFVQYPKRFADKDKNSKGIIRADGYNSGGYEWCIANWDTKWNACNSNATKVVKEYNDSYGLSYDFETAWSPPIKVIVAMSKKFKKLSFDIRFFECGMAFNGRVEISKGKILKDESGVYFGSRGG